MLLQVRVARRSSAAVLFKNQRSSGSKELGEEELENVSTSAVRRTTQASSECFCVHWTCSTSSAFNFEDRLKKITILMVSYWKNDNHIWSFQNRTSGGFYVTLTITEKCCWQSFFFHCCRRSTTAGGRSSIAKTRCGTWRSWWVL